MLIALLVLVGLFVLRVLIFHIDTFLSCNDSDVKLSYDNFMKFLNIASDKYELWNYFGQGPCVKYSTLGNWYLIFFHSYISWVRVKYYFYKKDHEKSSKNKLKATNEYLNCVKADLEKYTGEHNL